MNTDARKNAIADSERAQKDWNQRISDFDLAIANAKTGTVSAIGSGLFEPGAGRSGSDAKSIAVVADKVAEITRAVVDKDYSGQLCFAHLRKPESHSQMVLSKASKVTLVNMAQVTDASGNSSVLEQDSEVTLAPGTLLALAYGSLDLSKVDRQVLLQRGAKLTPKEMPDVTLSQPATARLGEGVGLEVKPGG